jgi:ABC-type spermidine/putrescine transport system permease subunit II
MFFLFFSKLEHVGVYFLLVLMHTHFCCAFSLLWILAQVEGFINSVKIGWCGVDGCVGLLGELER